MVFVGPFRMAMYFGDLIYAAGTGYKFRGELRRHDSIIDSTIAGSLTKLGFLCLSLPVHLG